MGISYLLQAFSSLIFLIQIVDSGSTAVFNCSVHGGKGQLLITWLRNGRPLSLSSKIDIRNNGEILSISSVNRDDRGMYQCFVRGEAECAQNSAELILGGKLYTIFSAPCICFLVSPGF